MIKASGIKGASPTPHLVIGTGSFSNSANYCANSRDVSTIRLCPFYPCLRVATLCVIFRSLPNFTVLNSGHFIWNTLYWASCFLEFPRSRLKRQSQCVSLASWSQHVSLSDFRGTSCFVLFNVTRAVLETLPSHMHFVALWSQRAAVKSRHTQQRLFSG